MIQFYYKLVTETDVDKLSATTTVALKCKDNLAMPKYNLSTFFLPLATSLKMNQGRGNGLPKF